MFTANYFSVSFFSELIHRKIYALMKLILLPPIAAATLSKSKIENEIRSRKPILSHRKTVALAIGRIGAHVTHRAASAKCNVTAKSCDIRGTTVVYVRRWKKWNGVNGREIAFLITSKSVESRVYESKKIKIAEKGELKQCWSFYQSE